MKTLLAIKILIRCHILYGRQRRVQLHDFDVILNLIDGVRSMVAVMCRVVVRGAG